MFKRDTKDIMDICNAFHSANSNFSLSFFHSLCTFTPLLSLLSFPQNDKELRRVIQDNESTWPMVILSFIDHFYRFGHCCRFVIVSTNDISHNLGMCLFVLCLRLRNLRKRSAELTEERLAERQRNEAFYTLITHRIFYLDDIDRLINFIEVKKFLIDLQSNEQQRYILVTRNNST